jgi:hypothetical protein
MWQIPVYAAERDAGIADLVRSTASSVVCAVAKTVEPFKVNSTFATAQLPGGVVTAAVGDFDLHYLKTILVTAGVWNKNDDVFDPKEAWAAKATPEDKPVNWEHNCKDIIGHITGNYAINEQGKVLADETVVDDLPAKFHIVTAAVLYKHWADKDLQERMDKTLAEIAEGKWFVSMEALFRGFDYAVVGKDGTKEVVARNDKTSFLTKHLRAYGGTGNYQEMKVGRLLRNIVFSGKGLVRNPANPESVILDDAEPFSPTSAKVFEHFNDVLQEQVYSTLAVEETASNQQESEKAMATELENLQKQLTEKQVEIDRLQASLRDNDVKQIKAQVETLQADIKVKDDEIKKLDEAKAKVEADLKTKADETVALAAKLEENDKAHKAVAEKLAVIEADKKIADRIAKVKAALKVDETKEDVAKNAVALATSLMDLPDDKFDAAIKAMAGTNMMTAPAPTNDPQNGNSTVPHGTAKTAPKATNLPAPMASASASEDANADTANLDGVEPEQAAAALSVETPESGVNEVQKAIASYFDCEVEDAK